MSFAIPVKYKGRKEFRFLSAFFIGENAQNDFGKTGFRDSGKRRIGITEIYELINAITIVTLCDIILTMEFDA